MPYRHRDYAANSADLIKHALLHLQLRLCSEEQKPHHYLDTHAGEGLYPLNSDRLQVLQRLMACPDIPVTGQAWLDTIEPLLERNLYPGSSALADRLLPEASQLSLYELDPASCEQLQSHLSSPRAEAVNCTAVDSRAIPAADEQALVFIDPPYSHAVEETELVEKLFLGAVDAGHSTTLWYPLHPQLPLQPFVALNGEETLVCEVILRPNEQEQGMYGCVMRFANPPQGMAEGAEELLEWLAPNLEDGSMWRILNG